MFKDYHGNQMDFNTIVSFVTVATLLVISPGPNGFLITKTVSLQSMRAAFANIWGFVAAFYVHGTLSIFGISVLLYQSAQAFFVFKLLGAAYLIWIGIKALLNTVKSNHSKFIESSDASNNNNKIKTISLRTGFYEGFLTNVLNPKVSMFYLAAFPQFISVNESVLHAYTLVTIHSIVNFIWFSAMILMLSRFKTTNNSLFKKCLNFITGIVFIGFGFKLALMENN